MSTISNLPGTPSIFFITSDIIFHFIQKEIKTPIAASIFSILKSHFNFVSTSIFSHGIFTSNIYLPFSVLILFAVSSELHQIPYL
ncbi:MAG: hypothetical protein P1U46_02010 [Patescibacteria group bacterium]|nr:hypothetical protein [Patescibacteria group bacterium]